MNCRFCKNRLSHLLIDLGNSPPSNSFLSAEELYLHEMCYPLKVYVCDSCFLVQIDEYKSYLEIFNNRYAYFSSYSTTWLAHVSQYCDMMVKRFGYNKESKIVEIASNDGYLLQYFKEKGIPVLGIEPAANTAQVAIKKGIPTIIEYFGSSFAEKQFKYKKDKADLVIGNNVLAHVPDINDFVQGLESALSDTGIITMEFPHLMRLIEDVQFDTIYHEHFSYLSFSTVYEIFKSNGLIIFDVEEIHTHGGSLRIYAGKAKNNKLLNSSNVTELLNKEKHTGVHTLEYYTGFSKKVQKIKTDFISFLLQQRERGAKVAAYGAAAKGNTLLNYCEIKNDMIEFVADAAPSKQNKYLPGSHIPVVPEEKIKELKPDFIIIFPWNIKEEIVQQLNYVRKWGGKFVTPVPCINIF